MGAIYATKGAVSDFENRLRKNAKQRFKWAEREDVTAIRLYDVDLPEWPFAVDWYAGYAHVMEYPRRKQLRDGSIDEARAEVVRATAAALELPPEKIFTKTHEKRPWGRGQYERLGTTSTLVNVKEHGLTFECNMSDYLDTGLFLDHRVRNGLLLGGLCGDAGARGVEVEIAEQVVRQGRSGARRGRGPGHHVQPGHRRDHRQRRGL